ncbi:MAG: restriction endonuclease subunit S [Treponema sp.]
MGKRVPKLRFPEFSGEWKEKKLGEVCAINPQNPPLPDQFEYIDLGSVKNGNLFGSLIINKDNAPSRAQRLLKTGDVLFQTVRPYQRNNYYYKQKKILPSVASTGYVQIRSTNNKSLFLYYTLYTDGFVRDVLDCCTGTSFPAINSDSLGNIQIRYPSIPEQQRIADFFSTVDGIIASEQRILDDLQLKKKGLMQELFSRELRFKDKDGKEFPEWEEKRLGEITNITSCKRVHQEEWTKEGIPFYRAREIVALHRHEKISPLYISEDLYDKNSKLSGKIKKGDLLVTGVGTIGIQYLVKEKDRFYFKDGNIIWIQNTGGILIGEFLYYLFDSKYIQSQIKRMAGVGTVGTYTIENANTTNVYIPAIEEQQKIATCLFLLDGGIVEQQKIVAGWKLRKKGLLQQMFV